MSKDFSLNLSSMGALLTCQFVGFTVFVVVSGIAADRIGKKNVLGWALAMLTLSCFLLSIVPNFGLLCVVLLFLGGGMGILETMSNALLADIDPENSVFQLNFLQVFFGIGAIVGPMLVGFAYSKGVSWRAVYQVIGVFLTGLSLWFFVNKLPELPRTEKIRLNDIKNLLADKKFLMVCLCMFAYTGAESSGWGWLSTYAESGLNFSVMESGASVAVFWIAVTTGRLIVARFIGKFDARKMIMILSVSSGIVCALMSAARQGVLVWIVIVFLGLACSSQWGLILSYGTERYRRNSGTVFAILLASGGIGMSLIPYLMGIAGDAFGMRISLLIPAALFVAITLMFVIIPKLPRQYE
jgi:fucose permease